MAKIKPGDKVRLGNSILHVDDKRSPGTDTTISSVQNEMNEGKGYKTILREIVRNTETPRPDGSSSSDRQAPSRKAKLISEGDKASKPATISVNKPAGSASKIIRINKSGGAGLRK